MLFNSFEFLVFLPICFIIYWYLGKLGLRIQNLFLLAASYLFYGWWDYRFLTLILFSTFIDYWVGRKLEDSDSLIIRKRLLWFSLVVNLGLLGFFKYYNFFVDSFSELLLSIGYQADPWALNIILPVGISFYTFQTLSYSIDVYRGKMKASRDFVGFATFVAFFPQLVAGPIERASHLLPQILQPRVFNFQRAIHGARLILWGMFKKVAIADALAPSVNEIFSNYQNYSSGTLLLGAFYFSLQIYCDFSGYSDIAIGISRWFGIDLMTNFRFPYFSRSIAEFWRRWHISLSTWFRDYVYIPLGGSRVNMAKSIRNVFIVFLVSGFWHGANWTFIIWGGIHALLFVPSFIFKKNKDTFSVLEFPRFTKENFVDILRIFYVFSLVMFAWIFFRAESVTHAFDYLGNMFELKGSQNVFLNPYDNQPLIFEHYLILLFLFVEIILSTHLHKFISKPIRWVGYVVAMIIILISIQLNAENAFIYFQF